MRLVTEYAITKPKLSFTLAVALCVLLLAMAILPSVWPQRFFMLNALAVDTDPENMLSRQEAVRVFHNAKKTEFGIYDSIVVGVTHSSHPQGVFNAKTLKQVYELTEYAKSIRWSENGKIHGVVGREIIAPSTVDNIESSKQGIEFDWLMPLPPQTDAEAVEVARKAARIPFLNNSIVSSDGKSLALLIPITSKNVSFRVASLLKEKIAQFETAAEYHITGMPVAQDQFGVEMFKQMAISAPVAMVLVFGFLWVFFRSFRFVSSAMIVALLAVIVTMSLLVVTGNTVHIMSSMIPIFIMPIAVLDSIHLLSEFFDRYPGLQNRRKALRLVMNELRQPMFFTTMTTCAGFLSLTLTPIPPVQVFGVFVAIGVFLAWLFTIALIPAFIVLMPRSAMRGFGAMKKNSLISGSLLRVGQGSYRHSRLILVVSLLMLISAFVGINRIQVNDNPVNWFHDQHEIRISDRVLNRHFSGTYEAYLSLSARPQSLPLRGVLPDSISRQLLDVAAAATKEDKLEKLMEYTQARIESSRGEEKKAWQNAMRELERSEREGAVFKNPEMLRYLQALQAHLAETGLVGQSISLVDIVKTVNREMHGGETGAFRIPRQYKAVAQTLLLFQNSHRAADLWHFVTPDFSRANVMMRMKSGDNRHMKKVVAEVEHFITKNPPPLTLDVGWFGLSYINAVWQEKMVTGMLKAFAGSFLVVFIMMVVMMRSLFWGMLCMVPLIVTISVIYGLIGLLGKDYDMPVAVLSSLSLGLAVDYAIHFATRSRNLRSRHEDWYETLRFVYAEPARAIARNLLVVGVGFTPLLAAPLIPYQTVGVLISSILFLAGAASLVVLPALIAQFESRLFYWRDV